VAATAIQGAFQNIENMITREDSSITDEAWTMPEQNLTPAFAPALTHLHVPWVCPGVAPAKMTRPPCPLDDTTLQVEMVGGIEYAARG